MKKANIILTLLVILSVITFLDRTCITFASMEIKEDLGIDQSGWGWVMSIFTLSYGLMQIPLGALGDRVGHRWVLALIVLWWSLFTSFTGMAGGLMSMLAIRFCFGIGEAGASPCSTSVISRWFEKDKVGKAQGFVWAATRLGGAAAPFIVIPLIANEGWRFSFYLLGGIGAIWSLVWVFTYRDRRPNLHLITQPKKTVVKYAHETSEKLHEGAHQAKEATEIIRERRHEIPWRTIFSNRQFWIICFMYFFYAFGSWFFFTWFPEFMKQGRGFAAEELKYAVAIPFIMSMMGNIAGGYLTDKLTEKYGIKVGRKALGTVCLTVSAICMVLAAFIPGKIAVFVFLSLCFGIFDLMLPSAWALCIDLGKQFAGSVSGAMNTFGNLGGFCCSLMFGYLLKASAEANGGVSDYNLPLYGIAGMLLLSAILFAFINPSKPIITDEQQ